VMRGSSEAMRSSEVTRGSSDVMEQ
jgi:hypothetical protein